MMMAAAPYPLAPPVVKRRRLDCTDSHLKRRNVRIKNQAQVTPWTDVWELQSVGQALLTAIDVVPSTTAVDESQNDVTLLSLEDALERVHVWRIRCQALPHAIESTFALAQTVARDRRCCASSTTSTTSTLDLSLSYCSAVIRTINGFVDVFQQQRATAASIASLAAEIGLPDWLVQIRHEATHNHMPSLGMLRLSAKHLLQYIQQVYWDPILERHREYWDKAKGLLENYRTISSAGATTAKPPTANDSSTTWQSLKVDSESESSSDDDSVSEEFHLGSSFNRFSVLKDKKPKAKRETKQAEERPTKKVKVGDDNPSPAALARKYVKAHIPIDTAFQAALTFLVWGDDSSSSPSALVPSDDNAAPESDDDTFAAMKHQMFPLLLALTREWPGFAPALLVHVVSAMLSADAERPRTFLCRWVQYLVSREFLVHLEPELANAASDDKIALQTAALNRNYPLNALCDRCRDVDPNSATFAVSLQVAEFMESILQDNRKEKFGIESHVNDPDLPVVSMSLDEMEAMLGHSELKCAAQAPKELSVRPWSKCETWDPCTIGSIPGFPV